jgi:hypothetical protein
MIPKSGSQFSDTIMRKKGDGMRIHAVSWLNRGRSGFRRSARARRNEY